MQQTVQSEVHSYASVVQKTYESAMTPKVIQTAARKATVADARDCKLIFHGMKEEEGENLKNEVGAVLNQIQEKLLFMAPSRVVFAGSGKVRPVIKVMLAGQDTFLQILKTSEDLKRPGIKFHLPQLRQNFGKADGEAKASQRTEEEAKRKS